MNNRISKCDVCDGPLDMEREDYVLIVSQKPRSIGKVHWSCMADKISTLMLDTTKEAVLTTRNEN